MREQDFSKVTWKGLVTWWTPKFGCLIRGYVSSFFFEVVLRGAANGYGRWSPHRGNGFTAFSSFCPQTQRDTKVSCLCWWENSLFVWTSMYMDLDKLPVTKCLISYLGYLLPLWACWFYRIQGVEKQVVQSNIFTRMLSWDVGKLTKVSRVGWDSWPYVRKCVLSFNLSSLNDSVWMLSIFFSQTLNRQISIYREDCMWLMLFFHNIMPVFPLTDRFG